MNAKQTFLESPDRDKFEAIAQSKEFKAALEYALLEMMQRQPAAGNVNDAWDCYSQICGARRFIEILENLPLPEPVPKTPKYPSLKYQYP